jgi:hypothetical protein
MAKKQDLIDRCKELGVPVKSSDTIEILKKRIENANFEKVLNQLVPVAKANKLTRLKNILKDIVLSTDCSAELDFIKIAKQLDITDNMCKTLYSEIPPIELLQRQFNLEDYLSNIDKSICVECSTVLYSVTKASIKTWHGKPICDICWIGHKNEREQLWSLAREYKELKCNICEDRRVDTSYHYDHLSMFNKDSSIYELINNGDNIITIYTEIDKCQILCVRCHSIVTSIEHKSGFTRLKSNLTRDFNNGVISELELIELTNRYDNIYCQYMSKIYSNLKILFVKID